MYLGCTATHQSWLSSFSFLFHCSFSGALLNSTSCSRFLFLSIVYFMLRDMDATAITASLCE